LNEQFVGKKWIINILCIYNNMSSTGLNDSNSNFVNSDIIYVNEKLTVHSTDSVYLTNNNFKDLSEYTYDLSETGLKIYMIYQEI